MKTAQPKRRCPTTVLWALGLPEGWTASPEGKPPCIETVRTLSVGGITRSLRTWVECEYTTLSDTVTAMRQSILMTDNVLAQDAARELNILPLTKLGANRFVFDAPDAEVQRVLGELRAQCVFGSTEEAASC